VLRRRESLREEVGKLPFGRHIEGSSLEMISDQMIDVTCQPHIYFPHTYIVAVACPWGILLYISNLSKLLFLDFLLNCGECALLSS
jgi:hypothetical protein